MHSVLCTHNSGLHQLEARHCCKLWQRNDGQQHQLNLSLAHPSVRPSRPVSSPLLRAALRLQPPPRDAGQRAARGPSRRRGPGRRTRRRAPWPAGLRRSMCGSYAAAARLICGGCPLDMRLLHAGWTRLVCYWCSATTPALKARRAPLPAHQGVMDDLHMP